MHQVGSIRRSNSAIELMAALRREVCLKALDGDQALARRIGKAKHGSQRSRTNLTEELETVRR
jgi:hypothetical protein